MVNDKIIDRLLKWDFESSGGEEFRMFVAQMPDTCWAEYDLSAVRLGWEAHKLINPSVTCELPQSFRYVLVYEYKRLDGTVHSKKMLDDKGRAKFHGWGVNYEEFETGAGNYSTAIVEREDGTVENVPAEMITFI